MRVLAMEFTSEFIHILQIESKPGMTKIIRALHLEMPQNCFNNGMLVNNDRSVSDLIATTLKEEKIKEKKAIVAVSSVDCMTEEFSIPNSKPKFIEGMVEQELQKRRKLSNSYIYDYVILGEDPLKEGFLSIRAVLCPKSLVNNYYDVLKKAGLSPMALDLTSHAMQFIAEKGSLTKSNEISILACINKEEIHFIYCGRNEEPYYRHAFIKQDNSIDESMFILSANNKFNFLNDDKDNLIENVIENITKLTRFHSSRHPDLDIKSIYIYGDYADIGLLCDRVTNSVGIPARNYTVVSSINKLQYFGSEPIKGSVNVLGTVLALYEPKDRNFEFFERLQASKKEKGSDLFWIPTIIAVFLALLVIVSYFFVNSSNKKKQAEIDELDKYVYDENNMERYYLLQGDLEAIDAIYEYNERADVLKEAIKDIDRFDSPLIKKVNDKVIEGVSINTFNYNEGEILISCVGKTQTSAADFTRELSKLEEFSEVTYSGFVSSVDTLGEVTYSFNIVLKIKEKEIVKQTESDEGGNE